jgi:hypothetical protein
VLFEMQQWRCARCEIDRFAHGLQVPGAFIPIGFSWGEGEGWARLSMRAGKAAGAMAALSIHFRGAMIGPRMCASVRSRIFPYIFLFHKWCVDFMGFF